MLELAGRLLLGGALLVSAGAKLADVERSQEAMATYGFGTRSARAGAWGFALLAEAGLGAAVVAGSSTAAALAAALMLIFAATLGSAVLQGKAGAPCACFGPHSTVGPAAIARNLLLAGGFILLAATL